MVAKRPSAFLYGILTAVPSFAKTHYLVWANPRALAQHQHSENMDRAASATIQPMRGFTFLLANLILLSVFEIAAFGDPPPFELPPGLMPVSRILSVVPFWTAGTVAAAAALWMVMTFCLLKLSGRTVTLAMMTRVVCYATALETGAAVFFVFLPILLLPSAEFTAVRGYLTWPVGLIGLFSLYWVARQLKVEGSGGGIAVYLGGIAASAAFLALQASPIWPIKTYENLSGSMLPTLEHKDYVVANKWAYFWRPPERGEIAAFYGSMDPHVPYLKRVIGIPGDKIQVAQGILHINGTPVERARIADFVLNPKTPTERRVRQYSEILPWTSRAGTKVLFRPAYGILEIFGDTGVLDNTPVYDIPEDHYFVLGDNRDQSLDSRVKNQFGFIPESHFVGPIYRRLLPPTSLEKLTSIE